MGVASIWVMEYARRSKAQSDVSNKKAKISTKEVVLF